MPHDAQLAIAATAALLLGACAHGPAAPAGALAGAVYPAPPDAPRARWVGEWPPQVTSAGPSGWQRLLGAVTGAEPEVQQEAEPLPRPFGLAAAAGALWIADPDAPAVVRIDWPAGRRHAVACAEHPWQAPIAVAVAAGGVVYVADGGAVVRVDGARCTTFGEDVLERPSGLAVTNDRLLVADPPRHAVLAFTLGSRPEPIPAEPGGEAAALHFPTAVAAAFDGSALVADSLNFRIVRLGARGELVGAFGASLDDGGQFERPKAVAVDRRGEVFVSDAERDAVLAFDADGRFEYAIGGGGPGALTLPAGVAVDGDRLYVADSYHRRVQIYELLGDAR